MADLVVVAPGSRVLLTQKLDILLMSDILFLAKKENDNKRVDVNSNGLTLSNTTTETDLVTQTANSGKDMYMAKASAQAYVDIAVSPNTVTARLKVNGITVETLKVDDISAADNPENNVEFNFKTKSEKVTTGQIIKITIQNGTPTTLRSKSRGKLTLWEENTDDDPSI